MAELASQGDGYHRIKPPDALIAASAQDAGIGVFHYDHDFDRLAEALEFESRWLAPPGTL
jgi:predicted nucleic acid-binding protein